MLIGGGAAVSGETNAVATFANVFGQSSSVYLGITVDDGNATTIDAEISPRQQLVTGAFAFRASVAESVDSTAITTAMLASGAVTTNQLGAAAVTTAKIAADAVTNAQILNGTIGVDELATGAVTSDKILDGTVTSADIAADTILAGDIAAGGVASSEILDASIVAADIADSAVTSGKIADSAVTSGKIANGSITGDKVAAGTITSSNLGTNTATTVENLRIVRGTVNANASVLHGSGFTATWSANGQYYVTFNSPFSAPPTVTVSGNSGADGIQDTRTSVASTTNNYFYIGIVNASINQYQNQGFSFIAIGPR